MKKMRLIGAITLSLAMASASVQAASSLAQIGEFGGKVLVNQGEGFEPVSSSAGLKVGDTIMTGEDGFATVSFGDCSVSVTSSTVFAIGETVPCAKGEKLASVSSALISPTADVADVDPGCTSAFCATPALLPLLLIGGAAATVGIIVVTKKKKNNTPAVSAAN
jgi:hypothetical protein